MSARICGKVVIVGDGAIGKTCLINSLTSNNPDACWDDEYVPTAAANVSKEWSDHGHDFEAEFWDTAGQEAMQHLRVVAYPETNVFLIGYDMNSKMSLENVVDVWVQEIKDECSGWDGIVLIGTKSDLWEAKGKGKKGEGTTWEEGFKVAQDIGAKFFVCTSAKTGYGVGTADADLDTMCLEEGMSVQGALTQIFTAINEGKELQAVTSSKLAPPKPVAPTPPGGGPAEAKAGPAVVQSSNAKEEKKDSCQCLIA